MVATSAAARGLDLPEVSLVLSAGAPVDATDYLHRAGRAGRIGATTPGALRSPPALHAARNLHRYPELTGVYQRLREVEGTNTIRNLPLVC